MPTEQHHHKQKNAIDYLLYLMAGTVVGTICFSVLLWALS